MSTVVHEPGRYDRCFTRSRNVVYTLPCHCGKQPFAVKNTQRIDDTVVETGWFDKYGNFKPEDSAVQDSEREVLESAVLCKTCQDQHGHYEFEWEVEQQGEDTVSDEEWTAND